MAKKKKDTKTVDASIKETKVKASKKKSDSKVTTIKKTTKAPSKKVKEENIQVNDIVSTLNLTYKSEDIKTDIPNIIENKDQNLEGMDFIASEEEAILVDKFKKASESPFELRVKGMKIYDSITSKMLRINFEDDYIAIGNKKYPYNIVRIINK
jgi:hypothetical protein